MLSNHPDGWYVFNNELESFGPNTDSGGFSVTNLGYIKRFYELYSQLDKFYPQLVGNIKYEKLKEAIFMVPCDHHRYNIDKFLENPKRAPYLPRQPKTWG